MKMLINGKPVKASDGSEIEVINPATHEVTDTVPNATQADIEDALEIAQIGKNFGHMMFHLFCKCPEIRSCA